MDNTKYIDTDTWEICDNPKNYIPVDRGIAKTICVLNKKGYITKSSCEGHHNIRFVDVDEVDITYLDEFKNDPRAIIKETRDDSFDYWTEVCGTSIYVVFKDKYELSGICFCLLDPLIAVITCLSIQRLANVLNEFCFSMSKSLIAL